MAAYSTIAGMLGVPKNTIQALRNNTPIDDSKLEALRKFTRTVVQERGWVSEEATQAFLDTGYNKAQLLEVITGIAMKTLSNYANHIMETPVDEAFKVQEWSRAEAIPIVG